MLFAASTGTPLSAGKLALVVCFSGAVLVFGVGHYRGWHRGWIRALPFDANFFLRVMSLVWLLSRLLPAWYLEWRALGRPPSGLPG